MTNCFPNRVSRRRGGKTTRQRPLRSGAWLLLAAVVSFASGCGRVPTDYGFSAGMKGRQSVNGFSALRQTFDNSGHTCGDVRRLSDRLNRTDTIVWTPQVLGPIEPSVTEWFEGWLEQGSRTLIYIVPDSGSEADYWLKAQAFAPADQRLEYRRRAARAINQRFRWRLNRSPVMSNGWFEIAPLPSALTVERVSGAWRDVIAGQARERGADRALGTLEFELEEYQAPPATTSSTSVSVTGTATQSTMTHTGPTGPADPFGFHSTTATPTETEVEFQPLLRGLPASPGGGVHGSGRGGETMVARVTSEDWPDSQIIVVAGGSLLTNYAFTRPSSRRLADRLVIAATDGQSSPARVGFLTTSWESVPISDAKPGAPAATGMELLTQWPLSLVTVHAVFLGVVACLILFPIFGRPRQVSRSSLSRFGDHIDAVAALMNKTRGEAFARQRISEYHRRMRGETSGHWVLPETPRSATLAPPHSPPAPAPPPALTPTPGEETVTGPDFAPGTLPAEPAPSHEKLRDAT